MNKKVLDFKILQDNLEVYKSKKICAMVKANAYGHGVKEIVYFLKDKVDFFGVCSLLEAKEVRQFCDTPILIVSPCRKIEECKKGGFHFIVDDFESLNKSKKLDCMELVHIKINVGMNRFGFDCDNKNILRRLKKELKNEKIAGICTHFPITSDKKTTKIQYDKFCKAKKYLKVEASIHFGGSEIIKYDFDYDMIRVGIRLYLSEQGKQVMKIISNIIEIKNLNSGTVGYDEKFSVSRPIRVALISIGYADGLLRNYSGGYVKIRDKKCPIIGNVCMDLCFIDVTDIECQEGEDVEVMYDANEISEHTGLIPYEVFTNFNNLRER